jgi:hypothetical protein
MGKEGRGMSRLEHFFSGLGGQINALEGRTPEDILQNGLIKIGSRSWSHPEFERMIEEKHDQGVDTSFARDILEKDRETLQAVRTRPRDQLLHEGLSNWRHGPSEVFIGQPYRAASILHALTGEFRENSKPNEVPLYRGASRAPHIDAETNPKPVSFSENRKAAAQFAAWRRKETGEGAVYIADPGELRGLRMEDYGVRPMHIRGNSEAEWLVDPDSIPIFNDRRKRSR